MKKMSSHLKYFVIVLVNFQLIELNFGEVQKSFSFNHRENTGYASAITGEKHKYGYELKDNKQFHHTTTEKDGVRLGCYGWTNNGKKFMTTYVADSRGYRLVPSQGVITVYPKTGKPRKVSLLDDDPNDEGNIQYDFPDGCKAAASDMKHQIRLPVTQKPIPNVEYVYSTPSNYYVPPGPSNIYAPHLIMVSKPSTPSNSYLPPLEISIPSTPGNTYLPPVEESTEESTEIITEETDSSNLIDHETTVDPNEMSQETTAPSNHYLPPNEPSTGPPSNMYLPPQTGIVQEIVPPKEEVKECPDTLSCCDDSNSGKFIIPIPLKKQNANECCTGVAKLILPVYNFDVDSIRKLKETIPAEIDATELIKNILQNLV